MKRATLILVISILMLTTLVTPGITVASGTPPVDYTWTLAALGQGAWIGGPLFTNGTSGGGGALSVNNGQFVARVVPTTWTEPAEDVVNICFDIIPIKPAQTPRSSMCITAPVTGTPTIIILFGEAHILRVTEAH